MNSQFVRADKIIIPQAIMLFAAVVMLTGMAAAANLPGQGSASPATGSASGSAGGSAGAASADPGVPIPPGFEDGLQITAQIVKELGLIDDEALQERVARIGAQVAACVETWKYPIIFFVIDLEDPNAFAIPGGFVFVTKGMLDLDIPDSELAHLLGHEISHVVNRHLIRMQRKNSLLAVLQQALLVGVLFGMKDNPSQAPVGIGAPDDLSTSQGKMALAQGVLVFGDIFRAMFATGFSREFELEADEEGMRAAGLAGYPLRGTVDLLSRLSREIYEVPGMAYWRTHPYFNERITAATSHLEQWTGFTAKPASPESISAQDYLLKLSRVQTDDWARELLLRGAARMSPSSATAEKIFQDLFDLQIRCMNLEPPFLRPYGQIIGELDRAISAQTPVRPVKELAALKERLSKESQSLYPQYLTAIASGAADTKAMERFLENYPDSDQCGDVHLKLGENYRLSDRPDDAAEQFLLAALLPAGHPWRENGQTALLQILPHVAELAVLEHIARAGTDDAITGHARERLSQLAPQFTDMQFGKELLLRYPDTPVASQVKERLNALGQEAYLRGRQYEAIGRIQKAVELYNRVLDTVPSEQVASEVRARLEQLQLEEQ